MDAIRQYIDHMIQEGGRRSAIRLGLEARDDELRRAIDSHKQMVPALFSADLGNVDVHIADGIGLERLFGRRGGVRVGQARATWCFTLPFLATLLFELADADSVATYVWLLLVPSLCHRLFGPLAGTIVGGITMLLAGYQLLAAATIDRSFADLSIVLDGLLCSLALFTLSLVHEIQLIRADRSLRERADIDALTRLSNRQRFRDMADQRTNAVRGKVGRRASLILIDIDFFKHINDSYGHDVGDQVLRATATRLLHNSGEKDVLGRLGGEEIGVLLFDATHEAAMVQAERLRRCLADAPIQVDECAIRVTLSLGVATFDLATTCFDAMFREADARLYAAKRHGRHRVQAQQVADEHLSRIGESQAVSITSRAGAA